MIKAKIIADSKNPQGDRITTMEVTFPRFILAEFNTHRMFSRNSASSRAIPFEKMVKSVQENPCIPIAWQKDHKGMQGSEYITDTLAIQNLNNQWLQGRDSVIKTAQNLNRGAYTLETSKDENGNNMRGFICVDIPDTQVTKQLCNRLLEPFMWHTVIVTATEWENFFTLRCPKYSLFSENMPLEFRSKKDMLKYVKSVEADEFKNSYDNLTDLQWLQINKGQAEIHIMALAEAMWDALNESIPKQLKMGEWHIPYKTNIEDFRSSKYENLQSITTFNDVKIATARCARVSYTVAEELKPSEEWQKLYPDIVVLDPDGWDREDFTNSWNEKISLQEYEYRLVRSTCTGKLSSISPITSIRQIEKDLELHDRLAQSGHWSPFEHCARAMTDVEYKTFYRGSLTKFKDKHDLISIDGGWCYNFKGFIQYRYLQNNNLID